MKVVNRIVLKRTWIWLSETKPGASLLLWNFSRSLLYYFVTRIVTTINSQQKGFYLLFYFRIELRTSFDTIQSLCSIFLTGQFVHLRITITCQFYFPVAPFLTFLPDHVTLIFGFLIEVKVTSFGFLDFRRLSSPYSSFSFLHPLFLQKCNVWNLTNKINFKPNRCIIGKLSLFSFCVF